jgi:hypothetical protein
MSCKALRSLARLCTCLLIALAPGPAGAESGPGNGTDAVKILFAEAQNKLSDLVSSVSVEDLKSTDLDSRTRNWLQQDAHWDTLKFYISHIRLAFQIAACEDSQGRTSSICFYDQNPKDPYVIVSLSENKNTSSEQAMAMLVHEAGHFLGEMDHLFLDRLAVQLVHALLEPKIFSVTVSSTEIVSNVFTARDECEAGRSRQAQSLLKQAQVRLTESCQTHHKTCDLKQVITAYAGRIESEPGVGFTMKVTCELKAILTF